MLSLKYTSRFKKDLKHYRHDQEILKGLQEVLDILVTGKKLPAKNHNHQLLGEFNGCWECHIRPDVLLIYQIKDGEVTILLLRMGSHAKLF